MITSLPHKAWQGLWIRWAQKHLPWAWCACPSPSPSPGFPLQSSSPVPAPPASLPLVPCRTVSPRAPGSVSVGKVSAPVPLGAPAEMLRPKAPRSPERQTAHRVWGGCALPACWCRHRRQSRGLLCVLKCILGDLGAPDHCGVRSTVWKWRGASPHSFELFYESMAIRLCL